MVVSVLATGLWVPGANVGRKGPYWEIAAGVPARNKIRRCLADASGVNTDARRVIVVGDLWIFDYGETPMLEIRPPEGIDVGPPREDVNWPEEMRRLLEENLRQYGP